jgi:hypothetical protein
VTLIVSNGCGSDTLTQTVNVGGVGIAELLAEGVQCYPNPFTSELKIIVSEELLGREFHLTDPTGHILRSFRLESEEHTVNLSELAAGIYFLKIEEMQVAYRLVKM